MLKPSLSSQQRILICGFLFIATFELGHSNSTANSWQQANDPLTLELNVPIERELSGGQAHTYRIALNAGQYALVQVEQRGIDVVLTGKGTDGKAFASVTLRYGNEGVEPLMIVADTAGEYILKVSTVNPKAAAGRYEAKVSELRAATEKDRLRAKAQMLCYEALNLSFETPREAKRKAFNSTNRHCSSGSRFRSRCGNQRCCSGWVVSKLASRNSRRRMTISSAPSLPRKQSAIAEARRARRAAFVKLYTI
jgi:hypothetical protein